MGTSTAAEAKDYFSHLETHEIAFDTISSDVKEESDDDAEDNESDELEFPAAQKAAPKPDNAKSYGGELIDLVFNKKKAEERKSWMTNNLKKETYLDYADVKDQGSLKYSQFINKEFILFSGSDCARSIPHIMDGFKPSQRKVLYACIKRKLTASEIKVAQLAGMCLWICGCSR